MTALYVLGAILIVLVVGVMVAPLFQDEGPVTEMEALPPGERREAALEAVRDIQFEYETGKMDEEEFRSLRAHFGRVALEAEDELEEAGESVPEAGGAPPAEAAAGDSADADGGACPECGTEVRVGSRFCPRCGTRQPTASGGEEQG